MLIKVIGIPIFKYSVKLIFIPLNLADSATIKLATDPNKVKFPANVVAIARVNQIFSALAIFLMKGSSSNTAGTFDTILLNIAEIIAISATLLFAKPPMND